MSNERKIRIAKEGDGARLSKIFAPYVNNTAITFQESAPDASYFSKKIVELLPEFPFLVLEEAGCVFAYAYASHHRALPAYRWCAEVSIYVDMDYRKKGGGSQLYTALLQILEKQGYVNVYAGITLPNEASVRIHEKFGFRPFAYFSKIGFKKGAWRDVGWWERRFDKNLQVPPAEPLSFAVLHEKKPEWISAVMV
jgi:L-amino acid N-acyltransferase YncA